MHTRLFRRAGLAASLAATITLAGCADTDLQGAFAGEARFFALTADVSGIGGASAHSECQLDERWAAIYIDRDTFAEWAGVTESPEDVLDDLRAIWIATDGSGNRFRLSPPIAWTYQYMNAEFKNAWTSGYSSYLTTSAAGPLPTSDSPYSIQLLMKVEGRDITEVCPDDRIVSAASDWYASEEGWCLLHQRDNITVTAEPTRPVYASMTAEACSLLMNLNSGALPTCYYDHQLAEASCADDECAVGEQERIALQTGQDYFQVVATFDGVCGRPTLALDTAGPNGAIHRQEYQCRSYGTEFSCTVYTWLNDLMLDGTFTTDVEVNGAHKGRFSVVTDSDLD